jgi:hypothetical protein
MDTVSDSDEHQLVTPRKQVGPPTDRPSNCEGHQVDKRGQVDSPSNSDGHKGDTLSD